MKRFGVLFSILIFLSCASHPYIKGRRIYWRTHDADKAVAYMQKATDKNPTWSAYQEMAGACMRIEQFGPAADAYTRALEFPDVPQEERCLLTWFRAKAFTSARQYNESLEDYSYLTGGQCTELMDDKQGNALFVHKEIGEIKEASGKLLGAELAYQESLESCLSYYGADDHTCKRIATSLEKVMREVEKTPEGKIRRTKQLIAEGTRQLENGDLQGAEETCAKLAAVDPGYEATREWKPIIEHLQAAVTAERLQEERRLARTRGFSESVAVVREVLAEKEGVEKWIKRFCGPPYDPKDYVHVNKFEQQLAYQKKALGNETLGRRYPGSNMNCFDYSGVFVSGLVEWQLRGGHAFHAKVTLGNGITYEYSFGYPVVRCRESERDNYLTFEVNLEEPEKSRFVDARLPIVGEESVTILGKRSVQLRGNSLIRLLNNVYVHDAQLRGISLFALSYGLLLDPGEREEFIKKVDNLMRAIG